MEELFQKTNRSVITSALLKIGTITFFYRVWCYAIEEAAHFQLYFISFVLEVPVTVGLWATKREGRLFSVERNCWE